MVSSPPPTSITSVASTSPLMSTSSSLNGSSASSALASSSEANRRRRNSWPGLDDLLHPLLELVQVVRAGTAWPPRSRSRSRSRSAARCRASPRGSRSCTAWASTCAVEWRSTLSPSGESIATGSTSVSASGAQSRSRSRPCRVADHDDRLGPGRRQAGRGDRVGARRPGRDDDAVGHGGGHTRCGHGDLLRSTRAPRRAVGQTRCYPAVVSAPGPACRRRRTHDGRGSSGTIVAPGDRQRRRVASSHSRLNSVVGSGVATASSARAVDQRPQPRRAALRGRPASPRWSQQRLEPAAEVGQQLAPLVGRARSSRPQPRDLIGDLGAEPRPSQRLGPASDGCTLALRARPSRPVHRPGRRGRAPAAAQRPGSRPAEPTGAGGRAARRRQRHNHGGRAIIGAGATHVPAGRRLDRLHHPVRLAALGHDPLVDGDPGGEPAQHPEPQRRRGDLRSSPVASPGAAGVAVLEVAQVGPGPDAVSAGSAAHGHRRHRTDQSAPSRVCPARPIDAPAAPTSAAVPAGDHQRRAGEQVGQPGRA